jgi:hypothetical protein
LLIPQLFLVSIGSSDWKDCKSIPLRSRVIFFESRPCEIKSDFKLLSSQIMASAIFKTLIISFDTIGIFTTSLSEPHRVMTTGLEFVER